MAHRGRLNVLTNILGKRPRSCLRSSKAKKSPERYKSSGDVKYHMGFSTDIETPSGFTHVVLGFNPSHLEIISPSSRVPFAPDSSAGETVKAKKYCHPYPR